jgi:hypothetical protein
MIGPLINARQVAALEKGRRRGGRRRERTGAVALLMEFDDDQEAIDIANDTDFGLSGAVHTRDISRLRIARRIHTGMIHVNDATHGDEAHRAIRWPEAVWDRTPERPVQHRRADHPQVGVREPRPQKLPIPMRRTCDMTSAPRPPQWSVTIAQFVTWL